MMLFTGDGTPDMEAFLLAGVGNTNPPGSGPFPL